MPQTQAQRDASYRARKAARLARYEAALREAIPLLHEYAASLCADNLTSDFVRVAAAREQCVEALDGKDG